MSCKAGNKSHKARCEKYKQTGRRAINKQKKAERHSKRMQRFADRKAAGKCYEYSKERTDKKRENHVPIGTNIGSNRGIHTDVAKWDSVYSKVNNDYVKQKKEMSKAFNNRKKPEVENDENKS